MYVHQNCDGDHSPFPPPSLPLSLSSPLFLSSSLPPLSPSLSPSLFPFPPLLPPPSISPLSLPLSFLSLLEKRIEDQEVSGYCKLNVSSLIAGKKMGDASYHDQYHKLHEVCVTYSDITVMSL